MIDITQLSLPEGYQFKEEILDALGRQLVYYVSKHSKTLVVRFDLHFPSDFPLVQSNAYISETIAYIVKKYKRHGLDPQYTWTMEQHNSAHPHYHIVLYLDGQKIRSYQHVFANAEAAWGRALDTDVSGCVHHCNTTKGVFDMNRNGNQVRWCDGNQVMQTQMQKVYNQISYLAKENTKAPTKDGLRNFGMSRTPNA